MDCSPGEGNGNSLQYFCLVSPMDRGAWSTAVHGVAKSWTRLKWFSMDCSSPGSSVRGDSPGENTEVCCHALLQGTFPTQRLNLSLLCLLHWQVGINRTHESLIIRWKNLYSFFSIFVFIKKIILPTFQNRVKSVVSKLSFLNVICIMKMFKHTQKLSRIEWWTLYIITYV